eukprot:TRINITY_DN350_c0_g7_i1.p1 TRINITY_DN350_c0_g7~~TRINITY_DN350_c0_g7_i1.p1  ORF type:complete len:369 (+),score=110.91 TRINITY_DN350_c0_g7_i1:213-1319(+)
MSGLLVALRVILLASIAYAAINVETSICSKLDYEDQQYPMVMGGDVVGAGFDVVTGESLPLSLVEKTYGTWGQVYTWTDPFHPDRTYAIPDQMEVVNTPGSFESNITTIYHDVEDYQKKSMHTEKHHSWLGFKSKSKTTYDFFEKFFEEDMSYSEHIVRLAWYQVTMPYVFPPTPSAAFKQAIAVLPEKFNSNPNSQAYQQYMATIASFGTDLVTQVVMGGQAKMQNWFHKCFLSTYSEHWVTEQSGWNFIVISDKKGKHDHKEKVDAKWWEYSTATVALHGGDYAKFQPSDLDLWRHTVSNALSPIEVSESEPVSEFVKSFDAARGQAYAEAVTEYLKVSQAQLDKATKDKKDSDEPHTKPSWCKFD